MPEVLEGEKGRSERDYSGFSTAEFSVVFWKYLDCDLEIFADRIKMHERDLKKIVEEPSYAFVGLGQVDVIVEALGQNLSHLVGIGELTPVPARDSRTSAVKMVRDEIGNEDENGVLTLDGIPNEEIEERVQALLELRRTLCVVSEAQAERLRRDAERTTKRREREKTFRS